ncbi:hypothetical protein SAMN00808754_0534 [Thermanaeromonas toyohensis ToBE]|uniref:Uncharacterized protein n=1 Tax=Thermanaeromonas toyohensis ToBE TaxID=698762 RepID=A0A1W1VEU3_9FIRM|nr:hypothetical protein [Thermanaeromonas toyohensis]SMB91845.1 hypothetical protein SAMN00808754_0534 [Thermanaeromonas toyohensis ToBE]
MAENVQIQRLTFENFIVRLVRRFQDKVVNVEFFCGECCKKAVGGTLTLVGRDFLELEAPQEEKIQVFTISGGTIVLEELVEAIIIPLKQVCSVEIPND